MSTEHVESMPYIDGDKRNSQTRPLWRNRDYLFLAGGQGISTLGSYMTNLALPLIVLTITHSTVQAGLIIGLRSLVMNLLSLLAGALADRWNRKWLMTTSELFNVFVVASIPIVQVYGHVTLVQLYLVAIVQGALFILYQAAESAALRHTVAREQLSMAAGQNEVINSLSLTLGPLLGGILYNFSPTFPFMVDALSFGLSALSLCLIRTSFEDQERVAQQQHIWLDMKEGWLWVWRIPLLRFLGILSAGLLVPCAGYSLLMIVLARHLHADTTTIGYVFAAGGVGSVLGALIASALLKWLGFTRLMIWSAWIWALLWFVYMLAPDPFLLCVMNCLGYAIVPIFMVSLYSYRIAVTPDRLQGRVNSVFRLISLGGIPLGTALTGVLLQYGPVPTIIITFIPQLAVAIAATFNRALRQARPLEEL